MLDFLRTNVRRSKNPDFTPDCLEWAGSFWVQPVVMWHRKQYLARRLLMQLTGQLPEGTGHTRKRVYVTCENPLCMNEAHIRVGTPQQIARNIKNAGKTYRTADHSLRTVLGKAGSAKFPITERANALRMLANGMTLAQVGEVYGCSKSNIHLRLKKWERIFGPSLHTTPQQGHHDAHERIDPHC